MLPRPADARSLPPLRRNWCPAPERTHNVERDEVRRLYQPGYVEAAVPATAIASDSQDLDAPFGDFAELIVVPGMTLSRSVKGALCTKVDPAR